MLNIANAQIKNIHECDFVKKVKRKLDVTACKGKLECTNQKVLKIINMQ